MIHHSAALLDDNRQAPAHFRNHQRYHQDQGWPDIAYHIGVDRNGNCYELRDTAIAGDTFTSYDPTGWLLVLAEGNFDEQQPSDAQVRSVAAVLAWGASAFGVDEIAAHRDVAATECPGDALYAFLEDGSLEAQVDALMGSGGVTLDRWCGPEAVARVDEIERGAD
jgi:N-acetylmuramoyl-L-alanine amidase-like protein